MLEISARFSGRQHFDMRLMDVCTISIPIPYASGTVNVYFAEKPVPALIDLPPNEAHYCEQLKNALRRQGYSLSRDIERVIVTHPHFDHCGLAGWIVEECGAEIWAFTGSTRYLENFPEESKEDFAYYSSLLEKAGVPGRGSEYLEGFLETLLRLGSKARVSRYLKEGDEIAFGSTLFRAVHVPGHTPWCFMMYDAKKQITFTGDFLIRDISSNAVLQRPAIAGGGYKSLKSYISSLKKVRDLGVRTAFPGHGARIPDVSVRTGEILSSIQDRRGLILSILARRRVCTPYEIMIDLFPDLSDWQILLGISEVIGHLELLEEENMVHREEGISLVFSRVP